MKKPIKTNSVLIAVSMLLILFLLITGYSYFKINSLRKTIETSTLQLSLLQDSVQKVVTKSGELSFEIQSNSITIENIKQDNILLSAEKKQLKNQVGKWKNLYEYTSGKLQNIGSGNTIIHLTDTLRDTVFVPQFNFKWNNEYIEITGNYTDSLQLKYKYDLAYSFTRYQQDKTHVAYSMVFDDPNVNVLTSKTFVVEQKQPKKWVKWAFLSAGVVVGAAFR